MNHRFKTLIAVFFVAQIVLPFTAPLHVCDLNDLFGASASHDEPGSQQNNPITPTPAKEAEPETVAFVSPLAGFTLSAMRIFLAPAVLAQTPAGPSPEINAVNTVWVLV